MTLYLKYRSQTIDELDLKTVRQQMRVLASSLDNLPHAFLFAGPRGTGKTSAARILAKLVNCENPVKTKKGLEPCNKCVHCKAISEGRSMDVIELDTASNRGIEDIRVLRESINLVPVSAKKKIYIMDEAHMLTTEAANAFLKTLEEPPTHAIFILATTDPGKLPATVRSRLTTIQFQKASGDEVARQLTRVIENEGLDIEEGVIELIAKASDGSFRDAIKMLESLVLGGQKVTVKSAEEKLLFANLINVNEFLNLILSRDVKAVLTEIGKYVSSGGSVKTLIDQLQAKLGERLLNDPGSEDVMSLLKLLFEARGNIAKSYSEELPLEVALIEWIGLPPTKSAEGETKWGKKKAPLDNRKTISNGVSLDPEIWAKILTETRSRNVSLEALLRAARPLGIDGDTLNVAVHFRFHKERLEAEQYRSMFEGVIGEVLGMARPRVVCTLEDPPQKSSLTETTAPDIIKAAEEIFGE